MIKYLLLRDNKQSGPYTCDELRQKGLKAYDLVWAEGKSAAWRYPSEVDELRSFAPIVEEQPFDRFFKKPSQTTTEASSAGTPGPSRSTHDNIVSAGGSGAKRHIYVTLPAGKQMPVKPQPVLPERQATVYNNQAFPQVQTAAITSGNQPVPENQRAAGAAYPLYKSIGGMRNVNEAILQDTELASIPGWKADINEENISQSNHNRSIAGEINPRAKGKTNSRGLQILLVAGCILVLLSAGMFIGMSIDKHTLGLAQKGVPEKAASVATPPVHPAPRTAVLSSPDPAPIVSSGNMADSVDIETAAAQKEDSRSLPDQQKTKTLHTRDKISPAIDKTQAGAARTAVNTSIKDSAVAAYSISNPETGHRTDMAVDKVDKDLVRNNLSNLVSIGASHYTVGAFGGISDLQLTVSNRSVYPLDLVVVEVQYIQANKKVFKTENLYFRAIGAGSALMQEAPKSTRGIKVQYKITLVNSKELGLSYSAL